MFLMNKLDVRQLRVSRVIQVRQLVGHYISASLGKFRKGSKASSICGSSKEKRVAT